MLLSTCCGLLAALAVRVTVFIHLHVMVFLCAFVSTYPFIEKSITLNDHLVLGLCFQNGHISRY